MATARKSAPTEPDPIAEYDARIAALHDAFIVTPRQSDAARLIGMPKGTTLRDVSRDKFGLYVSRGDTWPTQPAVTYADDDTTPEDERDTRTWAQAVWESDVVQRAVVKMCGARPTPTA